MAPLILAPTAITVDRDNFELTLWKMRRGRYKPVKKYPIAVGAIGTDTPTGLYFVEGKSRTPDWLHNGVIHEFDEPWTGDPDNPGNPFEGGFISLGVTDGVGIHGVKFDPRLGTRASHGCIRMATEDFLKLYDKVPNGTPVFIY